MKNIQEIAYSRYQMDWMVQRGYTIDDLMQCVSDYMEDTGESFMESYLDWESDIGFDGEIWASTDEFIDNEYANVSYMSQLLTNEEFSIYIKERLS